MSGSSSLATFSSPLARRSTLEYSGFNVLQESLPSKEKSMMGIAIVDGVLVGRY